jgi:hypothetical protein
MLPETDCPTPRKVGYSTLADAKQDAKRLNNRRKAATRGGQLTVYPCPAGGHYHLTHMAAADRKRLERKLRRQAQQREEDAA